MFGTDANFPVFPCTQSKICSALAAISGISTVLRAAFVRHWQLFLAFPRYSCPSTPALLGPHGTQIPRTVQETLSRRLLRLRRAAFDNLFPLRRSAVSVPLRPAQSRCPPDICFAPPWSIFIRQESQNKTSCFPVTKKAESVSGSSLLLFN